MDEGVLSKMQKLRVFLTEPHPSILGIRKRQQARLLSTLLLIAMPIFAFVQFTSELVVQAALTYLAAIIIVFVLYLGSRTKYYDVALGVTLLGITVLPIVIFLFGTRWQPTDLPRLMVWIFVALIGGALLTRTIVVLLQSIVISSLMVFIVSVVFMIPFLDYIGHFGTVVIICFFVLIVSQMIESYVRQIDLHAADIDRKRWELEVYTQLLRHDLLNDLQAILNSIELAELSLNISIEKVQETLSQSLSLGERMVQLLHVFSMPLEQPGTNLVEHIKEIALESQQTYSNLKIEISSTEEVHKRTFTASRLLTMVWTNVFRNAAQYAGNQPIVYVDISLDNDTFQIRVRDNGPGIPEEKKEWLFKRGTGAASEEHGLGLYLTRVVLESHDGSIELSDNPDQTGTELLIRIPAN